MKKELYLEDFAVGQVVASPQRLRVEKDDIIAFARKFDPQYFHLDEEAARRSIFGGLVASGWHTAAMTMRLLTERDTVPAGGSVGLGCDEMRWPIPVRPGDELHIETEVLEVRPSKSRPERGLVKMRTRTLNERGEIATRLHGLASHRRSRRRAASCSSSGQAERYQYVSRTRAWPR